MRTLGPPIKPSDTVHWREEEFRLLRFVDVDNGCRLWEAVNQLAKQTPDHGYRAAQQRYAAVRQRLINEGKLIRFSRGCRLMITGDGVRRFREIAGVSPEPKLSTATHRSTTYDSVGTCGICW